MGVTGRAGWKRKASAQEYIGLTLVSLERHSQSRKRIAVVTPQKRRARIQGLSSKNELPGGSQAAPIFPQDRKPPLRWWRTYASPEGLGLHTRGPWVPPAALWRDTVFQRDRVVSHGGPGSRTSQRVLNSEPRHSPGKASSRERRPRGEKPT